MNDRPEGNDGHENMCDDRSQNDLQAIHVRAKAKNNRAKAEKEVRSRPIADHRKQSQ